MKIAVVGLGKIGLPLAVQYAGCGHQVLGIDINEQVVTTVNGGSEPFPGEARLQERLADAVTSGRLRATTDTAAAVAGSDVVVVVVPLIVTPNGVPDFSALDSATMDISRGLTAGTLVIYETTLPVGTTRTRWKPMLEAGSGLTEGADFDLVFSPERVLTGRVFADLGKYPKLVGGLSEQGTKRATVFYEDVLEFEERSDLKRGNGVWDLGSAEVAELAKLAETTYRDVNIALANQFGMFAARHGVDVAEVIDAANSQPYSHLHRPGIAVGGHCIPVYPQLYLWNDPDATLVRVARTVNESMPAYAINLAKQSYGALSGARAVVLGASYRGGVKETAFSGVFPIVEALTAEGATVTVHDPIHGAGELRALGLTPHKLGSKIDLAILQTDHKEYRKLSARDLPGVKVIVDGRRTLRADRFPQATVVVLGKAQEGVGSR
ncbi:MAG: nucleotide sugar dehydrogenase [Micromonosporaceae bacterium]|nr:nucleotide sugar dehydrogenase [Micromonosporaceae bacterium]